MMAATNGEKPLELSVRNFGPIAEADIELRPLTVFVGPSNTGKSYLATLIYALHQFFCTYCGNTSAGGDFIRVPLSDRPFLTRMHAIVLTEEDVAEMYSWANRTRLDVDSNDFHENRLRNLTLPKRVAGLVRRVISNLGQGDEGTILDDALVRCFGVDSTRRLVHYLGDEATRFSLQEPIPSDDMQDASFRCEVTLPSSGTTISVLTQDQSAIPIHSDNRFPWFLSRMDDVDGQHETNARLMLGYLAGVALSNSVNRLGRPAYYLPADRAGAVRSHSALTGTLISMASRPVNSNQRATFSGTYGDFLERLVGLGRLPTMIDERLGALADSMESDVLGGEIRIDSNLAGYPSFFYRPDGWEHDLPLMNASSMVAELAPVVLYLRHVVQPGETLIIEEPESALHPAKQVELTRLLAAAVKAGIRIIITTHSEWVLEELANLVLMSELPEERREGLEGADLALSADEIGAWLFEPSESADGATVVREIPLDKEMGNFDSGFGLITTDLYNRYARISNRIERLKEG